MKAALECLQEMPGGLYYNDTLVECGVEYVTDAMRKYALNVIDRCIEVAMAEDYINKSNWLEGAPVGNVWSHVAKVKHELI